MEIRRYLPVEGADEMAMLHYLKCARKGKRLNLKEEKELLARSRSGERQATDLLVDAHQVLVVAVAESYDDDRLGLMDRIAEGTVALMSACRNYLPHLHGSFRRYCLQRIRKAIESALAEVASHRVVVWKDQAHHEAAPAARLDLSGDSF